jgi:hypothetical protein
MTKVCRARIRDVITEYQAARAAQNELAAREEATGVMRETPEYLRVNARTDAAIRALPWWRRWIEAR